MRRIVLPLAHIAKKEQNPSAPNKSMVRQNSRIVLDSNKEPDKKEKKGCCK